MNASCQLPSRRRAPPAGRPKAVNHGKHAAMDTSAAEFPAISANPANLSPDPARTAAEVTIPLLARYATWSKAPGFDNFAEIAASPRTANDHRNGMLESLPRDQSCSLVRLCSKRRRLVFLRLHGQEQFNRSPAVVSLSYNSGFTSSATTSSR